MNSGRKPCCGNCSPLTGTNTTRRRATALQVPWNPGCRYPVLAARQKPFDPDSPSQRCYRFSSINSSSTTTREMFAVHLCWVMANVGSVRFSFGCSQPWMDWNVVVPNMSRCAVVLFPPSTSDPCEEPLSCRHRRVIWRWTSRTRQQGLPVVKPL